MSGIEDGEAPAVTVERAGDDRHWLSVLAAAVAPVACAAAFALLGMLAG